MVKMMIKFWEKVTEREPLEGCKAKDLFFSHPKLSNLRGHHVRQNS